MQLALFMPLCPTVYKHAGCTSSQIASCTCLVISVVCLFSSWFDSDCTVIRLLGLTVPVLSLLSLHCFAPCVFNYWTVSLFMPVLYCSVCWCSDLWTVMTLVSACPSTLLAYVLNILTVYYPVLLYLELLDCVKP